MSNIFFGFNIISLLAAIFLTAVGIYDLILLKKKGYTISDKIQAWFPPWVDYVVMVGIVLGIWACLGPNYVVTVVCGILIGHFFWVGR